MRVDPTSVDLIVETLGPCRHPTPIQRHHVPFMDEAPRVLAVNDVDQLSALQAGGQEPPSFEPAGARRRLFFKPDTLTCGVLTCGGLCPGLNNVVRAIVLELTYAYGVQRILGFRYGYAGLASPETYEPWTLTPDVVEHLNQHGGTMLGSSRGPQELGTMVESLTRHDIGLLFVIGGDGGLRGAAALREEIARQGRTIGVIGIPKTIDNDLQWTWRSFGFDTAVEAATEAITAAHVEARGAWNGVGLVKLMGRHSGFIAAHATLASGDANFCLVPEVPFTLEGAGGVLEALERRLEAKHHAVVVVAEGAGQDLLADGGPAAYDRSGNLKLKDIGGHLRQEIAQFLSSRYERASVRYIDPSYMIRSLPANSFDAQYCLALGQHAVHAGMAGRTNMFVGFWHQRMINVPIALAIQRRRQIDPASELWRRVLETTGQPESLAAAAPEN